jgi:hypothetical protein
MNFQGLSVATTTFFIAVALAAGSPRSAGAADSHEFIIAADDGYGVQECLAEAGPCGQVVADAWCEAHGQGRAVRFGPQSAFSGEMATKIASTENAYVIRCGN